VGLIASLAQRGVEPGTVDPNDMDPELIKALRTIIHLCYTVKTLGPLSASNDPQWLKAVDLAKKDWEFYARHHGGVLRVSAVSYKDDKKYILLRESMRQPVVR
jgi:hypothetical protein